MTAAGVITRIPPPLLPPSSNGKSILKSRICRAGHYDETIDRSSVVIVRVDFMTPSAARLKFGVPRRNSRHAQLLPTESVSTRSSLYLLKHLRLRKQNGRESMAFGATLRAQHVKRQPHAINIMCRNKTTVGRLRRRGKGSGLCPNTLAETTKLLQRYAVHFVRTVYRPLRAALIRVKTCPEQAPGIGTNKDRDPPLYTPP